MARTITRGPLVQLVLLVLLMRLACWLPAHAAMAAEASGPTPTRLDDYYRDAWTSKDGAPTDIYAMAQTRDGWLWLATPNGLFRFDGVRFSRFQPRAGEALLSQRLTNFYAQPNGDLWLGYLGGGATMLRNGRLYHHRPTQPLIGAMYRAHVDIDGSMWLATSKGLLHYIGGEWRKIGEQQGYTDAYAEDVQVDQYGRLWASSQSRLFLLDRASGMFNAIDVKPKADICVIYAPDGRLWIQTDVGMTLLDVPHAGPALPPPPRYGQGISYQQIFDRDGNLWTAACPAGLCLIHASEMAGRSAFTSADLARDWRTTTGPRRVTSNAILEDAEGNIWASSSRGLERYRHKRVQTLPLPEKYRYFSLAQDGADGFWIVAKSDGDLWRYANGAATPAPGPQAYYAATSVPDGSLVLVGDRGIERRFKGRTDFVPYNDLPPGERGFKAYNATYGDGYYWVNLRGRGLFRYADGKWSDAVGLGLSPDVITMTMDSQEHLWLLYRQQLVDYHRGAQRSYGAADGIDIGVFNAVDVHDRTILFGNTGMAVRIGERFHTVVIDDPELLANATAIAADAHGDRWINVSRGLLHVRAADWQAFLDHPDKALRYELFDGSDGYPGANQIQATRMTVTNGGRRIWMAGKQGVAWIDTDKLARNQSAPLVQIVDLAANGQRHFADDTVALAAGTRGVTIDYTALSYVMPERVRFKYRLDGVDDDWQDAGTRRTAYYTGLRPGAYRFEVMAANEDGLWSKAPASMAFTIRPMFIETWWFIGVCVVLAALLIYLLHTARLNLARRRMRERMQERLVERERIARTLHDTFLQSVVGLTLRFQSVANNLPEDGPWRAKLESALVQADQIIDEGRGAVLGLRLSADMFANLDDVFRETGRALSENYIAGFSFMASGGRREVVAQVRDEIYHIGREAMFNAFQHAQATTIEAILHYGADALLLTIRDDGAGMDQEILRQGKRPGHWGLTGMRERADGLGADLFIRSRPGKGTEVVIEVPARVAYTRKHKPSRLRFWRRSF